MPSPSSSTPPPAHPVSPYLETTSSAPHSHQSLPRTATSVVGNSTLVEEPEELRSEAAGAASGAEGARPGEEADEAVKGKKRFGLSVLFPNRKSSSSASPSLSQTPTSPRHSSSFYEPFEPAHSATRTRAKKQSKKSIDLRRPSVDFEHARPVRSSFSRNRGVAGTASPRSSSTGEKGFLRRLSLGSQAAGGGLDEREELKKEKNRRDADCGGSPCLSPRSQKPVSTFAEGEEEERSGKGESALLTGSRVAEENGQVELTETDRHYMNRALTNLQLQHEFSLLSQIGALAKYGSPYLPHANGPNSRPPPAAGSSKGSGFFSFGSSKEPKKDPQFAGYVWEKDQVEESPINSYLFSRFIYNAPALRSAPSTYWTSQIQPFFDSFAERDLSSTVERGEVTKRRMLSLGIVRILGTYYSNCLKPQGPSRPAHPSAEMMQKIDLLVPGGMERTWWVLHPEAPAAYTTWLAVVEETKAAEGTTFRIISRVLSPPDLPTFPVVRSWSSLVTLASSLSTLDADDRLSLPTLPHSSSSSAPPSRSIVQRYIRLLIIALSAPHPAVDQSPLLAKARGELESFLLATESDEKVEPAQLQTWIKQAEAEEKKDDVEHERWVEVGKRVKRLRSSWIRYRRALIETDELDKTLAHVKKTSRVDQLPQAYQDAEEWARIWVAYALHYMFVDARTGPEVFNILRSFHELIPYGPVKVGLNLVNPTLAIRAIVQLILGQPIGQQSLFQRIWSHVCTQANKHQAKLIETFRRKISRDSISNALRDHVAAPYVERQKTKQQAISRNEDIVLTILRERGSKCDFERVSSWHRDFACDEGLTTYDAAGASSEAKLFADLKELLAAYYRHRDRIQVLEIALEPNTPKLLHATIAVFYDTIRSLANASKLSDRVADLQSFLNDLCKAVETGKSEPSDFINLVDRHHQSLYFFTHELAKAGTLLDPVVDYAKSGLDFLDSGIPSSSPTTAPSSRAGVDVEGLLSSIPLEQKKDILLEARDFSTWTIFEKANKDVRMRCDLLRAASTSNSSCSSASASTLDSNRLWQDFLAQMPSSAVESFRTVAAEQMASELRTGPGGDLEFAWWAAQDVGGAAGKGVVKAHMEAAKESVVVEPSTPRRNSTSTAGDFSVVGHDEAASAVGAGTMEEQELAVPTPRMETMRKLLAGYLEQVMGPLKAARAQQKQ